MASPDAWSRFYSRQTELTDWFVDFEQLKSHIDELLSVNSDYKTIVDIGCGSSMLGPKIANAHPNLKVYCIDTSVECLQALADNCVGNNCTFAIGDARKSLPFCDNSVDLIIDKGTSDAVARNKNGLTNIKLLLDEAKRVLQPYGILMQVTTDPPDIRIHMISNLDKGAEISFTKLPNYSNNLPVYTYKIRFSNDDPNKLDAIEFDRPSPNDEVMNF